MFEMEKTAKEKEQKLRQVRLTESNNMYLVGRKEEGSR